MPSRRQVLAGATAGVAGASVATAAHLHVEPIEPRSPGPDVWPLDRFDAANTGANRAASTPPDPTVAWRRDVLDPTVDASLVVGPDAAFASDVTYARAVVALDRRDGSVNWQADRLGGHLALADGRAFAAAEDPRSGPDLLAYDADDGAVRWRADHGPGGADHVVATDGTVIVGGGGDLGAYRASDGARDWFLDRPSRSPTGVAIDGGGLYGTVAERLVGFARRSWLDAGLQDPPPTAWRTRRLDEAQVPTIAGDRLLVARTIDTDPDAAETGAAAIAAHDAATGGRLWGAFRPAAIADPPGHSVLHARHLAVVGDLVVAGLAFAGEFRSSADGWPGDHPSVDAVVAVSLADGSVRWRRPVGSPVNDVAGTADSVVVGVGTPESGAMLALDPGDGAERWRVPLDTGASSVAPVDGAVFAATMGGRVVALR